MFYSTARLVLIHRTARMILRLLIKAPFIRIKVKVDIT
jgi:hypothetical protein